MALYLGGEKVKINLDGVVYLLNLLSKTQTINDTQLTSIDGYILTDKNGLYLTIKESE